MDPRVLKLDVLIAGIKRVIVLFIPDLAWDLTREGVAGWPGPRLSRTPGFGGTHVKIDLPEVPTPTADLAKYFYEKQSVVHLRDSCDFNAGRIRFKKQFRKFQILTFLS